MSDYTPLIPREPRSRDQDAAEFLPIVEQHARLARERGDISFAECLERDAAAMRRRVKGHADA